MCPAKKDAAAIVLLKKHVDLHSFDVTRLILTVPYFPLFSNRSTILIVAYFTVRCADSPLTLTQEHIVVLSNHELDFLWSGFTTSGKDDRCVL